MNKDIEFYAAVITVNKNGHISIFLDADYSISRDDIVLNSGILEFDESGKPYAIYGSMINYKPIPMHGSKPVKFNEEEAKHFCKMSLKEKTFEELIWCKKFPFIEKIERTYWYPRSLNVRYKKVDDFRLRFIDNCNVSIYEGNVIGEGRK